jgi:hypothetical protein
MRLAETLWLLLALVSDKGSSFSDNVLAALLRSQKEVKSMKMMSS